MSDFAIWMAGYVSVPLYPTLAAGTITQILQHSEARLLFVGKLDWREAMGAFRDQTDRMLALIETCAADVGWLSDAETLSYLHATVATQAQRVAVVSARCWLATAVARSALAWANCWSRSGVSMSASTCPAFTGVPISTYQCFR